MSIFKKIGKAIKGAAKTVGKATGVSAVEGALHGLSGSNGDARSDAANSMIRKNVTRQAGSGAIQFNTEEPAS